MTRGGDAMTALLPGDILLTRIGYDRWPGRIADWAVRMGERLRGNPPSWSHVVVAHHIDKSGTFWGAQGQPGEVAWVDMAKWLRQPGVVSNALQPKTPGQRKMVCDAMHAMVGMTHYDWSAIGVDGAIVAATAFRIEPLWKRRDEWGPGVPGHVVCSSAADYAYEMAGLESPKPDRFCTPGDWAALFKARGW